ncbi:MAG: flagellar biosynthesis protein FlhB [Pirellulaceae bacterium]
MAEQFGDKSQEATPYRRQKAREEGQVPQSQDLSSAALLVGATMILMYFGPELFHYLKRLTEQQLGSAAWMQTDPQTAALTWNSVVLQLARVLAPVFGLLLLVAVLSHLAQVGLLYLPNKLAPDFSRVDPLKGAQRLCAVANVVRLAFGLFKMIVVATVAAWCIADHYDVILALTNRTVDEIGTLMVDILLGTCLKIGIALLVLALFDYGFQRLKHERDLRMTSQEVREEYKMLQGDPHMAARRKQVQRQLVMNRVQSAVPKADVIVTNPTELAVAIQYDPDTMEAPIVVAKGAGVLAQRIRRLALEHHIPVLERKPLAQALYKNVDINRPIPAEQYAAVAEILRYVYQLQGKTLPRQHAA